MLKFGKETVYLGSSIEEFARIRQLLDDSGIPCWYDITDREARWLGPGRGTTREVFIGPGSDPTKSKIYEILVKKEDWEKALFIVRNKA